LGVSYLVFGNDPEGQKRYSPAQCLGTKRVGVIGDPESEHVSTSYVERQNLNMRMGMRASRGLRMLSARRLTTLIHSVALFHMHYNFVRIHQRLRITPAMEAGLSSHVWSLQEIVSMSISATISGAA
jgi:hypothetical protein